MDVDTVVTVFMVECKFPNVTNDLLRLPCLQLSLGITCTGSKPTKAFMYMYEYVSYPLHASV